MWFRQNCTPSGGGLDLGGGGRGVSIHCIYQVTLDKVCGLRGYFHLW